MASLNPRPAVASDAPSLLLLREAAATWMESRGIRQWSRGDVPLNRFVSEIARGEWHVLEFDDGSLAGALRVISSDEAIWGDRPGSALYVHGLMVDRSLAGNGVGAALLDWAQERALSAGAELLRLDYVIDNPSLAAFYAGQGFVTVGIAEVPDPWIDVVLAERAHR